MIINFSQQVRDHLAEQSGNPLDSESLFCTNIEGIRRPHGDPFWIQLHAGDINFLHLDSPEKDLVLSDIIEETDPKLEPDMDPGKYVNFPVGNLDEAFLNNLLNRLLRDYYEVDLVEPMQFSTVEL